MQNNHPRKRIVVEKKLEPQNNFVKDINELLMKRWHTILVLAVFLTIFRMVTRPRMNLPAFTAETTFAFVISFAVSTFFHWFVHFIYDKITEDRTL